MKDFNLRDEYIEQLGREMAREIDREILWGFLKEAGWTRVMLPIFESNEQAVDIADWAKEYCKGSFESSGRDYIFEDEKDAATFILKWM